MMQKNWRVPVLLTSTEFSNAEANCATHRRANCWKREIGLELAGRFLLFSAALVVGMQSF
jgi:hypothetical protein